MFHILVRSVREAKEAKQHFSHSFHEKNDDARHGHDTKHLSRATFKGEFVGRFFGWDIKSRSNLSCGAHSFEAFEVKQLVRQGGKL